VEGGKKIAVIVILIVVIVGMGARFIGGGSATSKMPKWLKERQDEKIDVDTGKLATQSLEKWMKAGQKDGKYKSPESGKYTMVPPLTCAACSEKVIPATFPKAPEMAEDGTGDEMEAHEAEMQKIRDEYKCPKCDGAAYQSEEGPM